MGFNVTRVPGAVGALALANFGLAIMIYSISDNLFDSKLVIVLGFHYAFIIFGILLILIYLARVIANPLLYIEKDYKGPKEISSVCGFGMATVLLGKAINTSELNLDQNIPLSIVYIGAVILFSNMICFTVSCWKTSTWPEPYWNNAFASIAFTALSLPGSDIIAVVVRGLSMSLTLLFMLMIQPIMFARILRYKVKKEDVVAENPSIAVLQAGTSIALSAWVTAPLTVNASSDLIGVTISHVLFAISTFGYVITLISIWERREALYNHGDGPGWVAFTFPFANTAIAAGLYQKIHVSRYSYALSVWVLIISAIAAINIISVDILFIWKGLYCYQAIGNDVKDKIPPPTAGSVDSRAVILHDRTGNCSDEDDMA